MNNFLKAALLLCLTVAPATAHGQSAYSIRGVIHSNNYSGAIERALSKEAGQISDELSEAQLSNIQKYYEETRYRPIWTNAKRANAKASQLVALLSRSYRHGFRPAEYGAALLSQRLNAVSTEDLATLEVALSRALIAYSHDLAAGRVAPNSVNRSIHLDPRAPTADALLDNAKRHPAFLSYVRSLEPDTPRYRRMITAMDQHRLIEDNGGWTIVPAGETLKPGMSDPKVLQLRRRLYESGDLAIVSLEGDAYDETVEQAVKRFQARHGLAVDGAAGPNTLKEMNVSISQRIAQMELNLERRRWLKDNLGDRFVFVNLADQKLRLIELGRQIWETPVIIGKTYHATPVFTESMEYIVLNPNWNIPQSIAVKEMLPQLRRDPGSLLRKNIAVKTGWGQGASEIDPYRLDWRRVSEDNFDYRLQQGPGDDNALGRLKFMFPNRHNIYIHDTPAKSLFSRTQRALSHGCIRAFEPELLATKILDGQGWSIADINAVLRSGERRVVSLKRPMPVYVTYLTAWVDESNFVQFRRDVYGRDGKLGKALQR